MAVIRQSNRSSTRHRAKPKGNAQAKFSKIMEEFSHGTLRSSSGEKVTDKSQALAIAYSEARKVDPQYGKRSRRKRRT